MTFFYLLDAVITVIITITAIASIIIIILVGKKRWETSIAPRESKDHLDSMVLWVTLDRPDLLDLQDITVLRATSDLLDQLDLQDITALRALQDQLDYLVSWAFQDHQGTMVPRAHLDLGPIPVFTRWNLALVWEQARPLDKKFRWRSQT